MERSDIFGKCACCCFQNYEEKIFTSFIRICVLNMKLQLSNKNGNGGRICHPPAPPKVTN
ncbi:hypothetical protein EXN66_Car013013 [Channa argus]|uniref:Uncharacterized protein n=1 Tax=Channa argus TaxID=215402 RepID=A0A6G1Q4P8_CHAAH|nr:hypothetical protein EXN66_Car013013 [Channa argus]